MMGIQNVSGEIQQAVGTVFAAVWGPRQRHASHELRIAGKQSGRDGGERHGIGGRPDFRRGAGGTGDNAHGLLEGMDSDVARHSGTAV